MTDQKPSGRDPNMAEHKLIFPEALSRAQGCLLGQLAGDALGSLVEFQTPGRIRRAYPDGVRELVDGGTWDTIAGQPTDDSEMALMLARMLVERGFYDPKAARDTYLFWINSNPFDCGSTISSALRGHLSFESQANGAMMRISPLGIFGVKYETSQVAEWAKQDAALTHPHQVCQQANALYVMAIAYAICNAPQPDELYKQIVNWAEEMNVENSLMETITGAEESPPSDFTNKQGWVLIAFRNALWQLLYAENLEEGIVDTVMRGGDTDTNAAICGALLGAVYGRESVPTQWVEKLLSCRPSSGDPRIRQPRPECMWPIDVMILAEQLLTVHGENERCAED